MEIILLERIPNLGQMGEVVRVKDGYARNFLLPQGKALRANDANKQRFESQRAELEARNLERKSEAETVHEKLDGNSYVIIRSAGETGQLYGSVSTRDIAMTLDESGFKVARSQVNLNQPIKVIGLHSVRVTLHPEVESTITVNVARSPDEANRQARGEDLTGRAPFEPEEEEIDIDLSEVFENPEDAEMAESLAADESETEAEAEAASGSDADDAVDEPEGEEKPNA